MTQPNADALLAARRDPAHRPPDLPHALADLDAAYAVQRAVQAALGPIGAWKVGSNAEGTFTCAPLPASHVQESPARVDQAACPDRGVEAEIAVLIEHDLPPRATPYSREEVRAAIASAHPAIELLQSRFADVDTVPPLSALADALSHHGFVWGPAIDGWAAIDLSHEAVRVVIDGAEVKRSVGHPSTDMLGLVVWLANDGAAWAGGLRAGQFVTTGSWTGKDAAAPGSMVRMMFDRCGTVEAKYV